MVTVSEQDRGGTPISKAVMGMSMKWAGVLLERREASTQDWGVKAPTWSETRGGQRAVAETNLGYSPDDGANISPISDDVSPC